MAPRYRTFEEMTLTPTRAQVADAKASLGNVESIALHPEVGAMVRIHPCTLHENEHLCADCIPVTLDVASACSKPA